MNWRNQSIKTLQSELEQLVYQIAYQLPTCKDYGLPVDRRSALREVEQLLSETLKPGDHGERAELLYLKAQMLTEMGNHQKAAIACRGCESEATRAFFGAKGHSLWLELRLHRIKALGEQKQWLAFERALSEMIGWLAGSSRTMYGRDLSAARYARGLCYQRRGLESDDPQTTQSLLACGLNDLEKVLEQEGLNRAIEAAKDRIALGQKNSIDPKPVIASLWPDVLGLVHFRDLPKETQALFLHGANVRSHGRFFAQQGIYGILFVLALFLIFAFATTQVLGEIFGPLSVIGVLATIPTLFMIAIAVKTIRDLYVYQQRKRKGAIVYGLLITPQILAVRTIEAFSDYTYFWGKSCVRLPLGQIRGSLIDQKPTYAMSGRMRHVEVLIIRYADEQDKLKQVEIPDRFDISVRKIHHLLQALNHDLIGNWQASSGNASIQFERNVGILTGYNGESLHFHWREIDGAALEITLSPENTDQLQSGLYHFDVNVKNNTIELIFLEGFGGTSLRPSRKTLFEFKRYNEPDSCRCSAGCE